MAAPEAGRAASLQPNRRPLQALPHHGVQLVETAGLEARGHEQHVGAWVEGAQGSWVGRGTVMALGTIMVLHWYRDDWYLMGAISKSFLQK